LKDRGVLLVDAHSGKMYDFAHGLNFTIVKVIKC
jgi:hypothetical protein